MNYLVNRGVGEEVINETTRNTKVSNHMDTDLPSEKVSTPSVRGVVSKRVSFKTHPLINFSSFAASSSHLFSPDSENTGIKPRRADFNKGNLTIDEMITKKNPNHIFLSYVSYLSDNKSISLSRVRRIKKKKERN
jgi:hypothetical protein